MDNRDALHPPRDQHPHLAVWWTNRRRLAYASAAQLFVLLVLVIFGPVRESVVPILEVLCWVHAFIILGYFGGNAALDVSAQLSRGRT